MQKRVVILFFLIGSTFLSYSQKFGYIDTDYILAKMPEYSEAQAEVNKLSLQWQEEIREMYKEIESAYSALQAEEVLLTNEMKQETLNRNKNERK